MKKTKKEKGITLLALIITIVVLLILAVVSIGAIKDSGIIKHAQNASNDYTIAQEKEQIQLALNNEWQIQKNMPDNYQTFKDVITAELTNVADVSGENNNGQLIITFKTGNTYNLTEDGKINLISSNGKDDDGYQQLGKEKVQEGQKVKYDGIMWTILYNDETNGLQIICDKPYNFFALGRGDSSIKDWNSLNIETDDFKLADLDGNKKLDTDLEKAIYSYNNAIITLNIACENLFRDEEGKYKNINIEDVRCVGSNPTEKNAENTTPYTSELLEKYSVNNIGKSTDQNFKIDSSKMNELGIYNIGASYWYASRGVDDRFSNKVDFYVRFYWCEDGYYSEDDNFLWSVDAAGAWGTSNYHALRPVIILKSDVKFNGLGTEVSPYTFE